MAMENGLLKMYPLLKMGTFELVMVVYWRVDHVAISIWSQLCGFNHLKKKKSRVKSGIICPPPKKKWIRFPSKTRTLPRKIAHHDQRHQHIITGYIQWEFLEGPTPMPPRLLLRNTALIKGSLRYHGGSWTLNKGLAISCGRKTWWLFSGGQCTHIAFL